MKKYVVLTAFLCVLFLVNLGFAHVTYFFREDSATTNGLNCRKLRTTRSNTSDYCYRQFIDPEGDQIKNVSWGVRIYERDLYGNETLIAGADTTTSDWDYCVAQVTRSGGGYGYKQGSWSGVSNDTDLENNSTIQVEVYVGCGYNDGDFGSWNLLDTWQTEQFTNTTIDNETWWLWYYTHLSIQGNPKLGCKYYYTWFYFDDTYYTNATIPLS